MNQYILVIVISQFLFTASDILGRKYMVQYGFTPAAFLTSWFAVYFLIRVVAMFGQLYVFTSLEVGKTMALFGATSIILVNILGLLLLKEVLSVTTYLGIAVAITAFLILSLR